MIKKAGARYTLYDADGRKSLGTFTSKAAAKMKESANERMPKSKAAAKLEQKRNKK